MKPRMSKKEEKSLYILGWMLLGVTCIMGAAARWLDVSLSLPMLPCVFHSLTGYYCPGCGGTRACIALSKGRIIESFLCHPVVVYGAAVYGWYMVTHTVEYLSRGRWSVGMRYRDVYLYLAGGIIVVQWVIRNLLKLIWGIDVLS